MSYFSFWHLAWSRCVTLSFCTPHSQLYAGRQRGEINGAIWRAARVHHMDEERRADVRGARPLYPLSEERCPLTYVPVVGGICLKAAGSKCFRFDINLPELKASRLSQIIKEASQI